MIFVLGIASKCLEGRVGEMEIRGRFEAIHAAILLRLAGILRGVLETREDAFEKPTGNAHEKNSQAVKHCIAARHDDH